MNKKEVVLENQEKEAFFEKVNKLPFGKVFAQVFKENTISASRELNLKEKQISGQICNVSTPFRMVLSTNGYEMGKYKGYIQKPVVIDICGHCAMPLMSFYAIESDIVGRDYNVELSVNYGKYSLLPEDDDRILLNIIHELSQKISQYQIEKGKGAGDAGGAGSRPKGI